MLVKPDGIVPSAAHQAAALGLIDRLDEYFTAGRPAARYPWGGANAGTRDDVNIAFWCECHGGQRRAAEYLLERGADLNWVAPWDRHTPLDAARRSKAADLGNWLELRGARSNLKNQTA